jgi:hypothetical protein
MIKVAKQRIKYNQVVEPTELEVSDSAKLVIGAVARSDNPEEVYVDIRTWIETDSYTGPTKRGISFDAEWLLDLIEMLDDLAKELGV